jgi:hypothetical protein
MRAMRYHEFGGPECLRDDVVERPSPAALGYASESAFSHAFKRVTGRAPKWVRRKEGAAGAAST